ncbi:MAG TPA: MBL fold metallo-hydrolase [Candidatus Hydrogenedentes bacterium]|nr:MBL fold metallo-hydrolase [Candidatus Hydrogenedentota bacterium]
MASLQQLSDDLWNGVTSTHEKEHHPFATLDCVEPVSTSVAFYKNFSNITVVKTGACAVLIDTGSFHPVANARSFEKIRTETQSRIHTAIYTHGHVDHAYGLPPFLEEADTKGWNAPAIIGHESVCFRMDRYIETAGYNSVINERQFGQPIEWPVDPIYPTETYSTSKTVSVEGIEFQLNHAKGETDDHTWVFIPSEKVLCTGDLFIWAAPNAGNPQKVQRYVKEWATALRQMETLNAEVLCPGHGVPVYGADRVREVLTNCAAYLESLYVQTLALLNEGAPINEIIHAVKPPDTLSALPYLQPIYDEPEFIVRTVHRCLAGWYSGIPSELKPASHAEQGREIVELAGGIESVLMRAEVLCDAGNFRMACHWADWAIVAVPDSSEAHSVRSKVYEQRLKHETSTMSRGVFSEAKRDSDKRVKE